jgi:hypothetical protein
VALRHITYLPRMAMNVQMQVKVQVKVHTSVVSCGRSRRGMIFTLIVCVLVMATRVARLEQVGPFGRASSFWREGGKWVWG